MFNKKELEEVKENMQTLLEEVQTIKTIQKEQRQDHQESLQKIQSALETITNQKDSYLKNLKDEFLSIEQLKEEFRKSVRTFELLHKRIYDTLYTRVHELLKEHTNDLKSTTDKYKSLSPEIQKILSSLEIVTFEVNKFQAVARTIKETDYSLSNHQNNLDRLDRDKLHLLKKVDSLQRLIGKERKNNY